MPTDNIILLKYASLAPVVSCRRVHVIYCPFLSSPLVHTLHTWQFPNHKFVFRLRLFCCKKTGCNPLFAFQGIMTVINHLSRFLC